MQDLRQNKLWLEYCSRNGYKQVQVATKDKNKKIWGILIPLVFGLKLLKIQRANLDPDWDELKRVKKRNRVVSTVIEPQKVSNKREYTRNGYRQSNFPYLSTKTVVVDLRKSQDLLWSNLSENAKRLIKKNNKTTMKEVKPEVFLELWRKNSKIWTLSIDELKLMKDAMRGKVHFWVSYLNEAAQSGVLLVETDDTANYFHSFTTSEGRISGAHYKLVWELMIREKKLGYSFFDFEGIYDKRWPQKRWLGFTEFKSKFGGKVISFPGTFHKWL